MASLFCALYGRAVDTIHSIVFFALGVVRETSPLRQQWITYGHWNLWLGVGFAAVTVIAGWFAYNSVTHDTPSHAAMTLHRNWALGTFAVFALLGLWAFKMRRQKKTPTVMFLVVGFIGLLLLTSTGWRGAELVYRYGLGVMSLPQVEGHAHSGVEHGHEKQGPHKKNNEGTQKDNTVEHTEALGEQSTMPSDHDDGHDHTH